MSGPSRKDATAARRTAISACLARGVRSQRTIKAVLETEFEIECSLGTVNRDIKIIRDEWKELRGSNMEAHIEEELAHCDQVRVEAWTAWRQSKVAETVKEESEDGEVTETRTVHDPGNPRFLEVAVKAGEVKRKLLGLDAPEAYQPLTTMSHEEWVKRLSQKNTGSESD